MRSLFKKFQKNIDLEPIVVADNRESMKALSEKVIEGIKAADVVVPILTEKSAWTQWINQEIGYAKAIKKRIEPNPAIVLRNE